MFNLKAHENDIINFRIEDLPEANAKVVESLINDGLDTYPCTDSRIEKQLAKLKTIREKAESRDEDYADYYEGELFKFAASIVKSGVTGYKIHKRKDHTESKPVKSNRKMNWNGDIVVDGKIIEDTTDEDLQMESGYESHATKEGFGQVTEHKKPSQLCKDAGLSGLDELAELSGQSVQTLNNWSKNPKKQKLLRLLIAGAVSVKS